MKKIWMLLFIFWAGQISAQTIIHQDPQIAKMVGEINQDSLKSYLYQMVSFGTRNTLSDQISETRGIGAARNWVAQKMQSFVKAAKGRLSVAIDTVTLFPDKRRIDTTVLLGNVVGTLKGTDPNDHRIFIMSAHLDNMRTSVMDRTGDAPGADDDASGCAAVIESCRILSQHGFPATILFVTFSGEEQGLLGANFMAKKAVKEGWQIEAVLNNDIMGSNNSNETNIINNTQIRVFSEGLPAFETEKNAKQIRQYGLENDGRSRQLARYVKEVGERYVANLQVTLIYRNDRFLRGGDHTPFVENGFAAVRFTEMNENYTRQHQNVRTENGISYGDLPEHIDFAYLAKNTAMNLANLANLAKAPSTPQQVIIETKKLTNFSNLSWSKPQFGKTKGYYVLVRETTSAFWQKKLFTTETNFQLPHSKDNYFFAVQSVSEDGNESLAIVPTVAGR